MVASNTVSDIPRPILEADRFSYAYPGAPEWVLRGIDLRIGAGECHLLQGPTGCGKSTLLMAIRDLLPPGKRAGTIRLASPGTGSRVPPAGLLLQNPKTQLLYSSLGADVAFGLENHAVDPEAMQPMVGQALAAVDLTLPLARSVEALSMGQQYRACLAGVLVMGPSLVMLDEPMAQLDAAGQERLLGIVRDLKRSGRGVLICDHRPHALLSVADRTWGMDIKGRMHETTAGSNPTRPWSTAHLAAPAPRALRGCHGSMEDVADDAAAPIVQVSGLQFDHPDGHVDLSPLSFCVSQGERVVIHGANGSGKTTLVSALSGLRRPLSGTITVFGQHPRLQDLRGRMTTLFQDPRRQIFEATVFDEVAFAARRRGLAADRVKTAVDHILDKLQLTHLSAISPHKLSYGQTHLVGLAAVLAGKPELVLLDDPLAGLDPQRTRLVMDQVASVADDWGATVIWTTHDPQAVAGWADRVIRLPGQNGTPSATTDQGAAPGDAAGSTSAFGPWKMGTGAMLCICLLLSTSAFAARTPSLLAILSAVDLLLLAMACDRPRPLLSKSVRFFFWQTVMVVALYIIRFGIAAGIGPGFQVSWQLFLAFWPGMIFMAATAQSRIVATLGRIMPHRTAFVAAACLRFLPMLLSEMQQIRATQTLRGARLLLVDWKTPRYWPDWVHCLLVPALIKTLSLAGDIATAATARDFGIQPQRTAWPGE